MNARTTSAQIAARRGVGTLPILTRAAPTVDFDLDLTRATGPELEGQRAALAAALDAPGDDADKVIARATEVAQAVTNFNTRTAQANAARAALKAGSIAHVSAVEGDAVRTGEPQREERLSPGQLLVRSDEFRSFAAGGGNGKSGVVEVPLTRAVITTGAYPSQATRLPGVREANPAQPLTILDVIDRQTMDSQVIEWVQELAETNAAAEVAEGNPKPESGWTLELKTSAAATIAHWVQITRQALADEGQMQGYLEGKLRNGLLKRLNGQILTGNGTSPNLRGILNTTGLGVYVSPAGEDKLIAIRKARTIAELSEYAPDTVVLNPIDWQDVELSTDDNGRFQAVVTVGDGLAQRVWGLNVISATQMTAGTALVGGFREGATLWEREGVSVYITDSHASTFTANIITMLAELRAVLSVWRPKAFVKVTFTPAA